MTIMVSILAVVIVCTLFYCVYCWRWRKRNGELSFSSSNMTRLLHCQFATRIACTYSCTGCCHARIILVMTRASHDMVLAAVRRAQIESLRPLSNSDLPLMDLSSIHEATNSFSKENKLGEGGFGPVYRVTKLNGQHMQSISNTFVLQ